MNIRDSLILASFVLGLIPLVILTGRWLWLGNWRSTPTGRSFMALFVVFIVWGVLSVVTLSFPGPMRGEAGEWVRITIRLVTDAILWNVLRVFLKAQARTAGVKTPARGIDLPGSQGGTVE